MPKQQSLNQHINSSSYRQNFWLSFINRKTEQLYQSEFLNDTKSFRQTFLIISALYILKNLSKAFYFKYFLILILTIARYLSEYRLSQNNILRLFVDCIALTIWLFILEYEIIRLELDPLYYHGLSIFLHYIFLPSLPLNAIIGGFVLYINKDETTFFSYLPIELLVIYFLIRRSRSFFVLMDSLMKQQKTFSLMIENSPNAIFVIDMHHRIHFYNNQAKNLLKKTMKNFSEKSVICLNIMTMFEEKYHEKINQSIFDCTLTHSTSRLFQIPILNKQDAVVPLIIEPNSSSISPKNLSFSKSIIKNEFLYTQKLPKYFKQNNFYNISIQNTFWKGGHYFLLTLENQEEANKLLEFGDNSMTLISGLLIESIDLMEKDYQKWNNFQAIKVIKESDLKDLASIVIECNRIKGLVSSFKNINQLVLERSEKIAHKFNIRNTMVQCMELISIKAIEKKMELMLKFEESFPEYVYGEYEHFKQLIYSLVRIINLSPLSSTKKPSKFSIFCKLNKYSDDGRFILNFIFEYEPNDVLEEFFKEILESYNPKEPFNYTYLLKHTNWALDQLALIPLMRLLSAEMMSQKLEEKSLFSMEIAFETSDQHLLSSMDKSNSHSSPSTSLLNKKPLQLSFCRISPNINNVIWREKPQAAMSINKQQMPYKKKNVFYMDFMKTSMKQGLMSQLEKDKENKESGFKTQELPLSVSGGVSSSNTKPSSNILSNPMNNLNITKGTPSFEFIKKEPEENMCNIGSSPSWKQPEPLLAPKQGNDIVLQCFSPINSSKEGRPPRLELSGIKKPSMKNKTKVLCSEISEKEIETSKNTSLKDFKDSVIGSCDGVSKPLKFEESEDIFKPLQLPERVTYELNNLKIKLKTEFERILYQTLEDIIHKQCPERIIHLNGNNKGMKRNRSDMQLFSLERPSLDSPKSSSLCNKKKLDSFYEAPQTKSTKKFAIRLPLNLIKSLVKSQKPMGESQLDISIELKQNPQKHQTQSIFSNFSFSSDKNIKKMGCFIYQTITHRRRWTLRNNKRKNSIEPIEVIIVGKNRPLNNLDISDGTYLRSLMSKGFDDFKINVCFVDGYEQFQGYLSIKLKGDQTFRFVFLEEDKNIEEIMAAIQKLREYELKKNTNFHSKIIIVGKNEVDLESLKKEKEIHDVLKLEGSDDDLNKLRKVLLI